MRCHAFHDFKKNYRSLSVAIIWGKILLFIYNSLNLQGFMQNFNAKIYHTKEKIINIRSEILFREAEDDFYYFNKINKAYKKLLKAVELTPNHIKSVLLLADICFIKGKIEKALNLYLSISKIKPDAKVLGGAAACYNMLNNYEKALYFCDKALLNLKPSNFEITAQITEIKINALFNLKHFKQAYQIFVHSQNLINQNNLKLFYNINYELLSKKINIQERLRHSQLKIV